MARLVATLPPRRTRQAAAAVFPRGPKPTALADKRKSNPDLWRFYEMPEVGKVADWTASGVSRVSFAPCVDLPGRTGDLCPPVIDDDGVVADGVSDTLARDAMALWSLVRSPMGGQSDLWRSLSTCLQVAADGWLFTYPADGDLGYDPDGDMVWVALARSALDERSGRYEVDVGTDGKVKVPLTDGRAVRVWRPHPGRPAQANSWVTRAQRPLELLEAIYEAIGSVALSRLNAGLILAATDQDRPDGGAMTVEEQDAVLGKPLRQQLDEAIAEHVEASAADLDGYARAIPAIVGLHSTLVKDGVRWLELARDMDPELGERIDDLRYRVAIACPAPPEMLLGLGDANHWNDEAVTTSEFQRSVQPDCELICDATTPHVLRAGLLAMDHAAAEVARVRVGYDPSALVDPPDRSEAAGALAALDDPPLTHAEIRDAMGMAEYAGPDEDERRLRLVERLVIARPEYGFLLPELGLPAPPAAPVPAEPIEATATEVDDAPAEDETQQASALPSARTAAAPPDDALGRRLVEVGVRYEDRLSGMFGAIVDQMVARAGNRVASLANRAEWAEVRDLVRSTPVELRGALPGVRVRLAAAEVDDSDLLGGALAAFAARFETETRKAQRQAVRLAGGDWDAVEPDAEQASAAAWALAGSLLIGEARRRFDGDLPPEATGEGVGAEAFAVPALLVRRVAAVAGGAADAGTTPTGSAASALLGVATGPLVQRTLARSGTEVVAWFWDYGDEARTPYEEHLDLHGTVEPGETPGDFDGWFPGDHNGCRCVLRPITRSGVGGDGVTFEPEEG